MNPEELKDIWSQQPGESAEVVRVTPELIWRLAAESARFERSVFWRDVREWLATLFVAGIFLYDAVFIFDRVHWLMIVAAMIACLPMTYVAWRRAKRLTPKIDSRLTDHIRDSIASVRHQIELLGSVARWYLAPLAVSGALAAIDVYFTVPVPPRLRLWLIIPFLLAAFFVAGVFFVVWKLKQHAVRKDLEPRLRRLQQTLGEIEND